MTRFPRRSRTTILTLGAGVITALGPSWTGQSADAAPTPGSHPQTTPTSHQPPHALRVVPSVGTAPGVSSAAGAVATEAPMPSGAGFWSVTSTGTVAANGAAVFHGDLATITLNAPIVAMGSTPDGGGYWLVGADGGVFTFGDARFYGSTGNVHLNQPIVGMAVTPDGGGYWLTAADGGVFTFGDARFYGSTGDIHLNQPVVAMSRTPTGHGYWLTAADGGIFTFGDAHFYGSTGSMMLNAPVTGIAANTSGTGYWLVAADGGVFTFGSADFHGSAAAPPGLGANRAVGIISTGHGYWVLTSSGAVESFNAPALTSPSPGGSPSPLPPTVNPATSIVPTEAYTSNCYAGGDIQACNNAALVDIDLAHAGEGIGALVLPANFYELSGPEQLIAVANAERTSRGLPAMPENGTLDGMAQGGADAGTDPLGPAGYAWGSNVAWGYITPLAADFAWMYDDGMGGTNADCVPGNTSGCWGHRDNILAGWGGQAGVAESPSGLQFAELFVENY